MADETELILSSVGNGSVGIVQGVGGVGVRNRQVTVQAIPESGYQFDGWVITKTLPLFAIANGPFTTVQDACSSTEITPESLYSLGSRLYLDDQGARPASSGYYSLGNNQYLEYNGNTIPSPVTCPSTSGGGNGGGGNGSGTELDTLI